MENVQILQNEEIDLVKKTQIVRAYKDTAKEGFKGKNYRIYAYGKDAFAVHEDDAFHKDLENGNVQRMMISVTEDGWSLDNYVTWTRANATKKNIAYNQSITPAMFKIAPVNNPEELA
jgi:hypothetical protein